MHRTLFRPQALLVGGLLFALVAAWRPGPLQAQLPLLNTTALTVPNGTTTRLQMATKKAIKLVQNSKENVLGVKAVPGDPTRVELTGQDSGITHLELTDVDGKVETFDIIVQADVEFLRIQLQRMIPTGNITPIPVSNNFIILRGTVNHIEDVTRALNLAATAIPGVTFLDDLRVVGDQQVQLCVTVAEVSRNQLRAMDFDYLGNSKNTFFGSTVGQGVINPTTIGIPSTSTTGTNLGPALFGQTLVGQPGAPNGLPDNLLFGVIHSHWGFLGFLQALRDEGVAKSFNEPTVTTLSGRPASFLVGGEQAVPVPAGLGQIGVQFEEFGTRLNVVPIVLGNGKIRLEIEPEVSRLDPTSGTSISGTVVPGRATRRINTTVELEDGQTFVLGGLVEKEVDGATQKTPILGDLPFLGTAFSSKLYTETERELVILVTPHLVDAEDCAQAPKVLPGDETRRPDDFELFLEGILEAPRGPRDVFPDNHYMAAWKNSPTAGAIPCAGRDGASNAGCSTCGADAGTPPPAGAPLPPPAAPFEGGKPMPTLTPMPPEGSKAPLMPPAKSEQTNATPAALPEPTPAPPAEINVSAPAAPGESPPSDPPPAPPGPGGLEPR